MTAWTEVCVYTCWNIFYVVSCIWNKKTGSFTSDFGLNSSILKITVLSFIASLWRFHFTSVGTFARISLSSYLNILHLIGNEIVAVDSPFGRLGLTVCYDLRFPELYQQLRFHHNCQVDFPFHCSCIHGRRDIFGTWYCAWHIISCLQVLLVPAAFTKPTGQAHWEILLRARAIETQCYVWKFYNLYGFY